MKNISKILETLRLFFHFGMWWERVEEEREREGGGEVGEKADGASYLSSLFNLLNTIVGGGVLALPAAYAKSGLAVGVVLTFVVGSLSVISAILLANVADHIGGVKTYKDLAIHVFGIPGALTIDVCLILFLYGTLTGYIVIITDLLLPFFADVFDVEQPDVLSTGELIVEEKWRILLAVCVVFLLLVPLSLLPRIDFLKYTSGLALVCISYIIVVIAIAAVSEIVEVSNATSSITYAHFSIELFAAAPVITFAFAFQTSLFPVRREMKEPERIKSLVTWSVVISGCMYVTVGVLGYLAFLDDVESNILLNFDRNLPVQLGKIALVIVLVFSYPLMNFACRVSVLNLLFPSPSEASCWDCWPSRVREWKGRKEREYSPLLDKGIDTFYDDALSSPSGYTLGPSRTSSRLSVMEDESAVPGGGWMSYIIVTVLTSTLALVLSLAVPDIENIFGLVGATAGSVSIFLFPAACAIKALSSPWLSFEKISSIVLIVFGTLSAGLGTFISIYNW
jgi:amino acid permease